MEDIEKMPGNRLVNKTYWICALSVDQHTVCCHRMHVCGKGHLLKRARSDGDTCTDGTHPDCSGRVNTGELLFRCEACSIALCTSCVQQARKVCSCNVTKHTAGDDACEVDKFDEMMVRLEQVRPSFYQTVALDKRCGALGRTWVVAEIAQAQRDRLVQKIEAFFPVRLAKDDIQSKIAKMDVRSSEASNPADTEMILAKIDDKDQYNVEVRLGMMKSIRPSFVKLCILILLGFISLAFIVYSAVIAATADRNNKFCSRHDCGGMVAFSVLCLYAAIVIFSHVEYGAIARDTWESSGIRHVILWEADNSSGARSYNILWRIQRWYARQSLYWDTPDAEAPLGEMEAHAALQRSGCTWCCDVMFLCLMRFYAALCPPISLLLSSCSISLEYCGVEGATAEDLDPSYVLYAAGGLAATLVVLCSDPAVRARSAEGLVLISWVVVLSLLQPILWMARPSNAIIPEFSGKLMVVPVLVLPCILCCFCFRGGGNCCPDTAGASVHPGSVGSPTQVVQIEPPPRFVEVQVPAGATPGTELQVPVGAGQHLQVLVPPGAVPGMRLQVPIAWK